MKVTVVVHTLVPQPVYFADGFTLTLPQAWLGIGVRAQRTLTV